MFTAFIISFLALSNIPTTPKMAVEMLNDIGIEATLSDRGISFFAPGFLFDVGSSEVSDTVNAEIELIVEILELNGIDDDLVYFEGHTDSSGDPELNLILGQLRAESVQKSFHREGLSPKRTLVASFGDALPISDDPAENRRVEVVVVDIKSQ